MPADDGSSDGDVQLNTGSNKQVTERADLPTSARSPNVDSVSIQGSAVVSRYCEDTEDNFRRCRRHGETVGFCDKAVL